MTEHENKSAILGSIILKTDTQCETGFATISIHFLVLNTPLDYAILGSLELENCQSIICMACKSITSILPYNGTFQWMSLTTYVSPSLQDASTTVCTHTNSSKKSLRNSKSYGYKKTLLAFKGICVHYEYILSLFKSTNLYFNLNSLKLCKIHLFGLKNHVGVLSLKVASPGAKKYY